MIASQFGAPDYFFEGGQRWQDQRYGCDPVLVPIFFAVVHYLSLLCPLPSYLLLHIRGRYSVLMLKDADECYTSDVNLACYLRLHPHLEELTPTHPLQLTVTRALMVLGTENVDGSEEAH